MDSKTYWRYVDDKKKVLLQDHEQRLADFSKTSDPEALKGQPRDGRSLFMISKENFDRGTTPGAVCDMSFRAAAKATVDLTHEVASAQQIAEFLAGRKAERDLINAQEDAKKRDLKFSFDESMLQRMFGTAQQRAAGKAPARTGATDASQ